MVWWLLLALATAPAPSSGRTILLEVRIFAGSEEVTSDTRVTVHHAGERTTPVARIEPREGRLEIEVPQGIYDVQAIREQDGRVLTIRWAERLVVMPYPDEEGRHLEVINLKPGFGALQIRARGAGKPPDVEVFAGGTRDKNAGPGHKGRDYALFVVPAGRYDVLARASDGQAWHTGVDVPLNRTRLWLIPVTRSDDPAARQEPGDDH
jgi:hypothetical protein